MAKTNSATIIDLGDDFDISNTSIVGYEKGRELKDKYDLIRLDYEAKPVTVIFPHYIWNVGNTFFRGMFLDSYKTLGKEKFTTTYVFESEPNLASIVHECVEQLGAQPVIDIEEDEYEEW